MGGRTSVSKVEDTNNEDDNGETRTDSDDPPNNKVTPFHDEDDTEQRQDKTAEDGEPVLIITEDNTFQNTTNNQGTPSAVEQNPETAPVTSRASTGGSRNVGTAVKDDGSERAAHTTRKAEYDSETQAAPIHTSMQDGDVLRPPSRSETLTPFTRRPRPAFPQQRLPLDDPSRSPRELVGGLELKPLQPWGDEVYEEARMICAFSKLELEGLYKRFTAFDVEEFGWITGEEFSMQPEFDANPLRDLIMHALEVTDAVWMDFPTYIEKMSIFNIFGVVDDKIRFLYKICDVNHDGVVDKGDFECYLMLVCGPELSDDAVVEIMERTFAQVDSDGDGYIDYDEFCKIVGRTDVSSKMSVVNF